MPGSDISRLSIAPGMPKSAIAMAYAQQAATLDIKRRIDNGSLQHSDKHKVAEEYKEVYRIHYYNYFVMSRLISQEQPSQRILYIPTDNPAGRKFYIRHAVASFTRSNCFVHVHKDCITIGRINYPLDEDTFIDTKEAFVRDWPGSLDREDPQLKKKTIDYVETLIQHDPQRSLKYQRDNCDEQRKTILKLLTELLHRNGIIDAPGITRLLLKHEQTEITKDLGNKEPLKTVQKYLLLGKRNEAIKFAKSRKLWDHAHCLAFLDKYQPQNTMSYHKDGPRLKDDSIVQLIDEHIDALEADILKTVYRSLLNRILQGDPESLNIVKHPHVGDNVYNFAILSANDCEMDFDETNEVFKLIMAVKKGVFDSKAALNHLISLGHITVDGNETQDDFSFRSHLSFSNSDTYASRTLIISNIDTLILNEIWEYCLNLANGTCNPIDYKYLINLVPYKLIFASKLLDYGEHEKFANYLFSLQNAIYKAKSEGTQDKDTFYDWNMIEMCVDYLDRIWKTYCHTPASSDETSIISAVNKLAIVDEDIAQTSINHSQPSPRITSAPAPSYQPDPQSVSQEGYPSLPYMGQGVPPPPRFPHSIPPPVYENQPIVEENDFNPAPEPTEMDGGNQYSQMSHQQHMPQQRFESQHILNSYNEYSNESESRRTSVDAPPHLSTNHGFPNTTMPDRNQKSMKSSSPVDKRDTNPIMADSFNAYSPINDYDDLPRRDPVQLGSSSVPNANEATYKNNQYRSGPSDATSSNKMTEPKPQSSDPQAPGFMANLAKAFLPKGFSDASNLNAKGRDPSDPTGAKGPKPMILPDDSKPTIIYDAKKGTWVDTTKSEEEQEAANYNEPPPIMDAKQPHTYSFAPKSAKNRYGY